MIGHGPIYDWSDFDDKTLKVLLKHYKALDELGMIQDEDLLSSIQNEIKERKKDKSCQR